MKHSIAMTMGLVMALALPAMGQDGPLIPPGMTLAFEPNNSRYINTDIRFRDVEGKKWPSFFYGRPVAGGRLMNDPANPRALFEVFCDNIVQPAGDQSTRILGEMTARQAHVRLRIDRIGPIENTTEGRNRRARAEVEGILGVGDRSTRFKGEARFAPISGTAEDRQQIQVDVRFQISGSDLGLRADGATGPISVQLVTYGKPQ